MHGGLAADRSLALNRLLAQVASLRPWWQHR